MFPPLWNIVTMKILYYFETFTEYKPCLAWACVSGHTHEDVDHIFSCNSRRLNRMNPLTMLWLAKEIGQTYSPAIYVSLLNFKYDMKTWMEEYAEPDLTGHINHYQFKQ